jgi:GNAT superfamily N-acetyltransferase
MASTDAGRLHPLGPGQLAGCLELSRSANWNQNAADWQLMLAMGRGWGITAPDGTLVASTLVLPYGGEFAWISMVLVLPEHRRHGHATRLLRAALAELQARGLQPVLDATPAGRAVYQQEGFADTWGFARYAAGESSRAAPRKDPGILVRPLADEDWQAVLQLDRPAFGASRDQLLRALAARLPEAAMVAERDGVIEGFLLGRDGRQARQLGPLVARSSGAARGLLAEALARVTPPVYLDLVDREPGIAAWLESLGFRFQRPFTRMVHGAGAAPVAPGEAALVFCPAGPELG